MATVVQQANRSLQATLLVDADGYLLVSGAGGGRGGTGPCPPPKETIKTITKVEQVEVVREVPVEVIKEVVKEKPVPQIVEIVKEVPVEKRIEVIREVQGPERIVYQDKLVEVVKEVVRTEVREIIKEKPVYPTEEELDRLLAQREAARQAAIKAAEEEARRQAEEEARRSPVPVSTLTATVTGSIKTLRGSGYRGIWDDSPVVRIDHPGKGLKDCTGDVCSPEYTVPWVELELKVTRVKEYPGNKATEISLDSSYYNQPDWWREDLPHTVTSTVIHQLAGTTLENVHQNYRLGTERGLDSAHGRISQNLNETTTLYGFLADVQPGAVYQFMWNALRIGGGSINSNNGYRLELKIVSYDKAPRGWKND